MQNILVLDYVTSKVTIYDSLAEVSDATNVDIEEINHVLVNQSHYVAGYDFYYLDDIDKDRPPLFKVKTSNPLVDRNTYFDTRPNNIKANHARTQVKDLTDDSITTYPNVTRVIRLNLVKSFPTAFLNHLYDKDKPLSIYDNRWIIKLESDTRSWDDAIPYIHNFCKAVVVKDLQTGVIKDYKSLKEATDALEVNYSTVKTVTQVNLDLPLRIMYGRWVFKHTSDNRSFDHAVENPRENLPKQGGKKVKRIDVNTKEELLYNSLSEAAEANGMRVQRVWAVIKDSKVANGYLYRYAQ